MAIAQLSIDLVAKIAHKLDIRPGLMDDLAHKRLCRRVTAPNQNTPLPHRSAPANIGIDQQMKDEQNQAVDRHKLQKQL